MTGQYFLDRASEYLTNAGAPLAPAEPLAAWAERARELGDMKVGVLVAQDGRLLAHTRYTGGGVRRPGVSYVTEAIDPVAEEEVTREVGLAGSRLRRVTGLGVVHVSYSDVCTGRGRLALERTAQQWREAREAERARKAELDDAIRVAAAAEGMTEVEIAEATGANRTTVRRALGKPR